MRNNFWIGIALGLIAPLLAWLLSDYTALQAQLFPGKKMSFYLIALAINLLGIRYFFRKDGNQDQLAKGLMLLSFLAMLLVFYCFMR